MADEIEQTPLRPAVLDELRQIQVYQVRPDGVFVGFTVADESPLEPGNYLVPGYCVTEEPPEFEKGDRARWDWGAEAWVIEPNPEAPTDAPPPPDDTPPKEVSIRQFTQALAETGKLSWEDARGWASRGLVPPVINDIVEKIEDDLERSRTLMFLEAAKSVEPTHPKTLELAALMQWSEEELVGIMKYAATL